MTTNVSFSFITVMKNEKDVVPSTLPSKVDLPPFNSTTSRERIWG